ncbi:MAG: multidrug efflux SMR transporter [Jannaschia helgolandensis]|jgi:quaternary ammonium compound-resistance protein SugE|uniref:Guanidinium exporter n=1 Tax=Jannaschia helgolandensis TaxID=188906 RepID=A0A1H7RBJ5_9RHOB|nr:multidrug efflux SMR transporter [Jannaschia helgolandensis]SEL56807.1 quaternary ammonium compound-resistance protein SugE [Jannaschia helgolandensis]
MAWIYLALAAVFEVAFAVSMKMSDGLTRTGPTVITIISVIVGLWLLALAMRDLPVSVAYPIWTALGAIGTIVLGWLWLGEAFTPLKVVSVALIVAGVAGLKVSAG